MEEYEFVNRSALARRPAMSCEHNESAETRFNQKRGESLVKLFFLDNLKRLKNKSENLLTRNR
jgi:hypothetical protein